MNNSDADVTRLYNPSMLRQQALSRVGEAARKVAAEGWPKHYSLMAGVRILKEAFGEDVDSVNPFSFGRADFVYSEATATQRRLDALCRANNLVHGNLTANHEYRFAPGVGEPILNYVFNSLGRAQRHHGPLLLWDYTRDGAQNVKAYIFKSVTGGCDSSSTVSWANTYIHLQVIEPTTGTTRRLMFDENYETKLQDTRPLMSSSGNGAPTSIEELNSRLYSQPFKYCLRQFSYIAVNTRPENRVNCDY